MPTIYNVTVPRNYGGYLREVDNVDLIYVSHKIYDIGIIEIESPLGQKN